MGQIFATVWCSPGQIMFTPIAMKKMYCHFMELINISFIFLTHNVSQKVNKLKRWQRNLMSTLCLAFQHSRGFSECRGRSRFLKNTKFYHLPGRLSLVSRSILMVRSTFSPLSYPDTIEVVLFYELWDRNITPENHTYE